jgi:hypothetical protein
MFYPAMRPHRTFSATVALLFALVLPLQGYAAVAPCSQHPAAGAPASNAVAPHAQAVAADDGATATAHCAPAATSAHHFNQHFNCGDHCCCAAIVSAPLRWMAPRSPTSDIAVTLFRAAPSGLLDRLDRPPRRV